MSSRTTKNAEEPDSLIKAIAEKLAAQDDASRIQRATALAASLFPDEFTAEEIGTPSTKDSVFLADLGQDPGERAVGTLGICWDNEREVSGVRICMGFNGAAKEPYSVNGGLSWRHFRHIPATPETIQFFKDYLV